MHDLEVNGEQVAFALRGEPAWHKLANVTFDQDEHVTTAQMLDSALLSGWDVRLEPVQLPDGYRTTKDSFMVVRDNPFDQGTDVLSIVGERYHTYQNEQLFAFGDNLLEGGGEWESAGSIKGGRTVFGSMTIGDDIVLDPEGSADRIHKYLLLTTSHDGSSAIQAMTTPVRVVCQNTLNMALAGAKQSYKVRHTATAEGRVDQARKALSISFKHLEVFEAQARDLYETAITDKQFADIVQALYPMPDPNSAKVTITKYENKIDIINDLYFTGITNNTIKGTAWGALNALTERVDYYRLGRKGTDEGIFASASGFDPQVNAEKARILSAVKEVAGV